MVKKKFYILCFLFIGLIWISPIIGQDSTRVASHITDSLIIQSKKPFSVKNYFKEDYPSPKKAITLAVIPGMGQIYNKRYWKLPLVYGALGGVIYAIRESTRTYTSFRDSYIAKTDDLSALDDLYPTASERTVKALRDSADKNRQLAWIGLVGFYLISAGDAFVDAHLKDFNITDDISMAPSLQYSPLETATVGISFKININKYEN